VCLLVVAASGLGGDFALHARVGFALVAAPGLLGAVGVVEPAHDGHAVGRAVADLLAQELLAEGLLGLAQDRERDAAELADELGRGAGQLVAGVELVEEQTRTALLGVGLLAGLAGDLPQGRGVERQPRRSWCVSSPRIRAAPVHAPSARQ
jgi:hypothetical protein